MSLRVLIAGIGNIFLSDDGFGVEVAQRLLAEPFPDGVRVVDFGIRGLHLAYELGDGYDAAILIDAAPRGGQPGTIYVIEPDLSAMQPDTGAESPLLDAHGMEPVAVLSLLKTLGGKIDRVLIIGCEPETSEDGIGLSEPVSRAVDEAVGVVRNLVAQLESEGAAAFGGRAEPAGLAVRRET